MRIRLLASKKGSKPYKSAQTGSYFIHFGLSSKIDAEPDPDQAYHYDADAEPDPTYHINLMQIHADPDLQHCLLCTKIKVLS
jgi:hypothetical protein